MALAEATGPVARKRHQAIVEGDRFKEIRLQFFLPTTDESPVWWQTTVEIADILVELLERLPYNSSQELLLNQVLVNAAIRVRRQRMDNPSSDKIRPILLLPLLKMYKVDDKLAMRIRFIGPSDPDMAVQVFEKIQSCYRLPDNCAVLPPFPGDVQWSSAVSGSSDIFIHIRLKPLRD
jgi:hypothetical protein